MRTRAWAMKPLNTQLASWTQLRHDTVLYVEPSYSSGATCYSPAGFVEPVPAFWGKGAAMARAADRLAATPFPDVAVDPAAVRGRAAADGGRTAVRPPWAWGGPERNEN